MFIYILPNIGGSLLTKLEGIVVDSGYYIALELNGEESYVIGLYGSFPEEVPIAKRICIATPDIKKTSRGMNTSVFCSTTFRSVKKIRGDSTLGAFLSKQKRMVPLTVSC